MGIELKCELEDLGPVLSNSLKVLVLKVHGGVTGASNIYD